MAHESDTAPVWPNLLRTAALRLPLAWRTLEKVFSRRRRPSLLGRWNRVMQQSVRVLVLGLLLAPTAVGEGALVNSLKVLSFNVWHADEGNAASVNKLREIIQTSGADVIGVQEMQNSTGASIAAALGFHYHQQSSGDIQVLSRYPITAPASDNLGVQIELSPGQNAWLFNAHLAPYPYQPYDLRDGVLPMNEASVIAAANSARGGATTGYLNAMAGAFATGSPVFFVGDFNEPSHLDWTAEAAAASQRPYDLKVEYPTSKRIVDIGMTDSFRTVHPDEVAKTGYTWTPGYPPPTLDSNEVHDRIDVIYHRGLGVTAVDAATIGPVDGDPNTDISIAGYNADHRAVVATYTLSSIADLDGSGLVDALDWGVLRSNQHADLSGYSADEAWRRGDITGDFRNDFADFVEFKTMFEGANGPGSFAAMLAVPEPATATLALLAWSVVAVKRTNLLRGKS
jgi:endonuclease/exonuclease/phosphatase family metal-dependent hydrolase